jgi:hypothetical protein
MPRATWSANRRPLGQVSSGPFAMFEQWRPSVGRMPARPSRCRIVARWATEVKPRSVAPAYPLTAPAVRPET